MPTPLEIFIADCQAQVAARRQQEQADKAERDRQFQELKQSVFTSVKQRLRDSVPQPLRQFVDYAGADPTLAELQRYPATWTPCNFKVEAPGLQVIRFITRRDDATGPMPVVDIKVGDGDFQTDWVEAVAAAAAGSAR